MNGTVRALVDLVHRGLSTKALFTEDAVLVLRTLLCADNPAWSSLLARYFTHQLTQVEMRRAPMRPVPLSMLYVLGGHTLGKGSAFFSSAVPGSLSSVDGTVGAFSLYYKCLAPLFKHVVATYGIDQADEAEAEWASLSSSLSKQLGPVGRSIKSVN
jgi:hypothetical protein